MSNIASLAVVTGALIFSDPSIVISSREEYSEVNNSQFFYTESGYEFQALADGVGFHIRSNAGQSSIGTVTKRIDFEFAEQQDIEQINTHLLLDYLDVNDYVANIDPTYKYNYDIKIYTKTDDEYVEIFSQNYIIANAVDGNKSFDEYIQINKITTSNLRVEIIHNYKMYNFDQITNFMLSEIEIFPEKLDNIALGTNITVTSEGDVDSVENPEYLVDENIKQACRVTFSRNTAPTYEMSGLFFADVELEEEITINMAQFVVSFYSGGTLGSEATAIYRLQYFDSEWINIINETVDMTAEELEFKTVFRSFALDDINIKTSKIRIVIDAESVGLFNAPAIGVVIHEIMLFSTQRQEYGLIKVYNQTLACNQITSNPVKFSLNNDIWTIPLVDTNDSNASAVRIFDGTSVKAIKKMS